MNPVPLDLIYVNPDALTAWPVTWGVPLAQGEVRDETLLSLHAPGGETLPVQTRVLRRHADGSIARLLVHSEVDVPPEATQTFELRSGADGSTPSRSGAVRGDGTDPSANNAITGGAGTLSLRDGELLLRTNKTLGWIGQPDSDFVEYAIRFCATAPLPPPDDKRHALAKLFAREPRKPMWHETVRELDWTWGELEIVEHGPLLQAAIIEATCELATPRLTLRMSRTQPLMFISVLIQNLTECEVVELSSVQLTVSPHGEGQWHGSISGEVRQVTKVYEKCGQLSFESQKLAVATKVVHGCCVEPDLHARRLLNYNETWLALHASIPFEEQPFVIAGFRDFYELFPCGLSAQAGTVGMGIPQSYVKFEFYPTELDKPWRLEQGRGKTHEIALAFPRDEAGSDAAPLTPRAFGYAFGKPPMPRVTVAHHEAVGSLTGLLPHLPDTYPRMETTLYDLTYNRNRGYGKMNWGDDYSVLYTNQLRGKGEIVWNNLEGDHPFHMWRQFVRTGRYIYYKEFRESILHWADVDFCDKHPDPMKQGALTVHSAGHTSGHASPCHNWAESFREWYFATGDPRPRDILGQMADWLMRKAEANFFKTDPYPYVRGCGWGLIQMCAIVDVLDRDDIDALARDLSQRLLDFCRANNGLVMLLPTGGNWSKRDNAFHTATVVVGAWRHFERTGDELYRTLAVEAAQVFMDERTCTPEGIAVYITGPEQDFPMQQAAGLTLAGLAVAYRLTGEEKYVRRGMRMLEYCLDRGMIVDHMRIPGEFITIGDDVVLNVARLMPNTQLLSYQLRGMLLFMRAAHDAGMLKKIDYVF